MNPLITAVRRRGPKKRLAATTVEMAFALSLFLTLILGFVDLGYGVFRQHVLSQAARQLARQAIVRGQLADRLTTWGPGAIAVSADEGHEAAEYIAPKLIGWNLSEVNLEVSWMDGGNDVRHDHRVHVELSAPYRPVMTFIFGQPSIALRASSTMSVAH